MRKHLCSASLIALVSLFVPALPSARASFVRYPSEERPRILQWLFHNSQLVVAGKVTARPAGNVAILHIDEYLKGIARDADTVSIRIRYPEEQCLVSEAPGAGRTGLFFLIRCQDGRFHHILPSMAITVDGDSARCGRTRSFWPSLHDTLMSLASETAVAHLGNRATLVVRGYVTCDSLVTMPSECDRYGSVLVRVEHRYVGAAPDSGSTLRISVPDFREGMASIPYFSEDGQYLLFLRPDSGPRYRSAIGLYGAWRLDQDTAAIQHPQFCWPFGNYLVEIERVPYQTIVSALN